MAKNATGYSFYSDSQSLVLYGRANGIRTPNVQPINCCAQRQVLTLHVRKLSLQMFRDIKSKRYRIACDGLHAGDCQLMK